jgi:hypothetical protein
MAISRGQGQEAGQTFKESAFGRKPILLATVLYNSCAPMFVPP